MSAAVEPNRAPPLLDVAGLTVRYGASTVALKDVSLVVPERGSVAILGSNGAGKTTMLRAISGVLVPHGGRQLAGTIRLGGEALDGRAADRRVREGIVQVPEGRQVFASLTVEENLRLGRYARRAPGAGLAADLHRAYDTFPVLGQRRTQPAGLLSGGEQQMLAIARALMADPRLLILDEPSLGLAPRIVEQITQLLKEIHASGTAMVVVEQNARVALDLTDHAYVLAAGELILDGRSDELSRSDEIQQVYLGGELQGSAAGLSPEVSP